jgi:hypothetical protein
MGKNIPTPRIGFLPPFDEKPECISTLSFGLVTPRLKYDL